MAFGRNIVLVAALALAAVTSQSAAAQTERASATMQQLVANYAAAWGSRAPDRIAALHTPDTVFDLRIAGEMPQTGRQAVRERFARILRDNPGYASTVTKVEFGPDFVVIEYRIAMNPPAPFVLGRVRYVPTAEPYVVPAIDVIRFRDGLVSEKVTFLDVDTIRTNSLTADAMQAPK
jgi:uncharacterized protein (TIGR02246 family)